MSRVEVASPLDGFVPDPARACHINERMSNSLAESIENIATACNDGFDLSKIRDVCERIRRASVIDPLVFGYYYRLLDALRAGDDQAVRTGLGTIATAKVEGTRFHTTRWIRSSFDPARAEQYLRAVNLDPKTKVEFADLELGRYEEASALVTGVLDLLDRFACEISGEIRELVREVVLLGGFGKGDEEFDGATSFYCWGTMFLNADQHTTLIKMLDGLAHESAHAHLFGVSLGAPYTTNPTTERYPSPLRKDPRPIEGIFHATYVSARMHYALSRLLTSNAFSDEDADQADEARDLARQAFYGGLATLDAHARITPLGTTVLDNARQYMWKEDV